MTPRARGLLKLLALLAALALAWLVFRHVPIRELLTGDGLGRLGATLRGAWWGSVVFVVLYAVLVALDFSGLVLTLAGGALFGFWWGALLNTIGANLGASGAFWLARGLGREGLRVFVGDRLSGLDRLAEAQGPIWLLRLRLIPVVPFNLLNLAAGLTAMPWRGYAAATVIGILPGTLVYTYFADALVAGVAGGSRGALLRVLVAGALLVILSFLPNVARRLQWWRTGDDRCRDPDAQRRSVPPRPARGSARDEHGGSPRRRRGRWGIHRRHAVARAVRGEWLLFLHADVRLAIEAQRALVAAVQPTSGVGGAMFRFAIDLPWFWKHFIELGQRVREMLLGLPYGDQGLLVRRELFEAVDGYPEIPLMEDVAIIRRLRRRTAIRRLPATLLTSGRRYLREGIVRTWLRHTALITLYYVGVPPHHLARWRNA